MNNIEIIGGYIELFTYDTNNNTYSIKLYDRSYYLNNITHLNIEVQRSLKVLIKKVSNDKKAIYTIIKSEIPHEIDKLKYLLYYNYELLNEDNNKLKTVFGRKEKELSKEIENNLNNITNSIKQNNTYLFNFTNSSNENNIKLNKLIDTLFKQNNNNNDIDNNILINLYNHNITSINKKLLYYIKELLSISIDIAKYTKYEINEFDNIMKLKNYKDEQAWLKYTTQSKDLLIIERFEQINKLTIDDIDTIISDKIINLSKYVCDFLYYKKLMLFDFIINYINYSIKIDKNYKDYYYLLYDINNYINDNKLNDGNNIYIQKKYIYSELQNKFSNLDKLLSFLTSQKKIYMDDLYITEYKYYSMEKYVSNKLVYYINNGCTKLNFNNNLNYLNDKQSDFINKYDNNFMNILEGGPGTGKSHTISQLINKLIINKQKILVLAPTGMAVSNLKNKINNCNENNENMQCLTIHRCIYSRSHPEKCKGDCTTCIINNAEHIFIDEAGMIDLSLFYSFLIRISKLDKLIRITYIGDTNQLSPIGKGNIFNVIVDMPFIIQANCNKGILTDIMRQKDDNIIPKLCESIKNGNYECLLKVKKRYYYYNHLLYLKRYNNLLYNIYYKDDYDEKKDDKYKQKYDQQYDLDTFNYMIKKYQEHYDKYHINKLPTFAIVSNTNRYCSHLNNIIQSRLNNKSIRNNTYYKGDLIIITENDYDRDILNGNFGYITDIIMKNTDIDNDTDTKRTQTIVVNINVFISDDEINKVNFTFQLKNKSNINEDEPIYTYNNYFNIDDKYYLVDNTEFPFSLGYCTTIHKFQGSERDTVYCFIDPPATFKQSRNLLYTAISRAKNKIYLYGDKLSIIRIINNKYQVPYTKIYEIIKLSLIEDKNNDYKKKDTLEEKYNENIIDNNDYTKLKQDKSSLIQICEKYKIEYKKNYNITNLIRVIEDYNKNISSSSKEPLQYNELAIIEFLKKGIYTNYNI
jgi:exodeoxyribonuclease V alpha subunit